ncbi:MAG: isoprenylcysteine carboxylmethyltransferase family protein [Deltaproteobacteria bacterium]|nr:isoprenylcysteine carboxylmethyltransferase family protein [Deltaproteobacteria bacterium]
MAIVFGLQRFFHDIRYHRERYRQFIGISFVILISVVGKPEELLFFTGLAFVFLGIAVRLWSSGHIKKNRVLATDGPYAFVRHPLYVGNITLGFGFALASSLWWSLPLLILILLIFYPQAVRREDENLHHMFKKDWEQWRTETPALIPRISRYRKAQGGKWSFTQSLRQNGEPIIALFLLFWLYFLSLGLH